MASNKVRRPGERPSHLDWLNGVWEMPAILQNDSAFFQTIRKKDYIDVEFKVIEEPKQIGDGTK